MTFWQVTAALAANGGLLAGLLPRDAAPEQWRHYPERDAVNGPLGARWFYHCHDLTQERGGPTVESAPVEHGHFHLFVARRALPRRIAPLRARPFGDRSRPSTVHIAALAIDHDGLPLRWFATNRWVTGETLYPAAALTALLPRINFCGDEGPPSLNMWLTAMLRASVGSVAGLLARRDAVIAERGIDGEDRSVEILATEPVDWTALAEA